MGEPASTADPARDGRRLPSVDAVSGWVQVLLSVLVTVGGGALGFYALSSALVLGGRTGQWVEGHRWVCVLPLPAGCALLAVALAAPVWPLAPVGAALVLTAASSWLWLNV